MKVDKKKNLSFKLLKIISKMYLIIEKYPEKNKKYLVTKNKWQFSNSKDTISFEELEKIGNWGIFKLWNKEYLITKPTLSDYITYGLKRQTQIIYPIDSWQIVNLLGLQKNDVVFESWIWSGALSLIILNNGVNLFSFEKREEFITLAKSNIKKWEDFIWYRFNHKIYKFDIIEEKISEEFYNFFDKWILDIRYPEKAKYNIYKMLKKWGILLIWVPTVNQVINVIKEYEDNFFIDEIIQISSTKRIRLADRLRPEDWQVWSRGFIIKLIKYS